MKISQNQLQDLLELVAVDQLLERSRIQLADLNRVPELEALEAKLLEASAAYLTAHKGQEQLEAELKRLDADLEVVLARIKRDEAALNASTNAKDASGLEHEMQTLARRKGELEDQELEIMEQISAAKEGADQAKSVREGVESQVREKRAEVQAAAAKLASGLELQANDRAGLAGRIPHELLELYAAKSRRGVPVARLINRECGACNMSLTAAASGELAAKAADELVTCPECGAILVR